MVAKSTAAAKEPRLADLIAQTRATMTREVEELRYTVADLQDQLQAIEEYGLPKTEYIARVAEWVDHVGAEFAKDASYQLSTLRDPAGKFVDVAFGRLGVRGGLAYEMVAGVDVAPFLCWLAPELMKKRLADLVNSTDYPEGPPAAERATRRKQIVAELDRIESMEEALIEEAQAAGITIHRRVDARPEIVLGAIR